MNEFRYWSDGEYKWVETPGFRNMPIENAEPEYRQLIKDRAKNKSLFLDIGANFGLFCINLSKEFDKIIAFEPFPYNIMILKENLRINEIHNVEMYTSALWNRNTKLFINKTFKGDTAGGIVVSEYKLNRALETYEIQAITLDSLNLKPDIIKIDVEGSDLRVLKGMKNTLNKYKPPLLIEVHSSHPPEYPRIGDIRKLMGDIGYNIMDTCHSHPDGGTYFFNYNEDLNE